MDYPKNKFPHMYEFQRLGRDYTPEGRLYLKEHQNQVDNEYSDIADTWKERYKIGGIEKIHLVYERQDL